MKADRVEVWSAGPEDLDGVAELQKGCGLSAWCVSGDREGDPELIVEVAGTRPGATWDGYACGQISSASLAGFAMARRVGLEAEILQVGVDPDRRLTGVGRLLLDGLLERLRHSGAEVCFLEVRQGNQGAVCLYRSAGFEEVDRRRAYFRNPVEDAIVMRRGLTSDQSTVPPSSETGSP